MQGEARTSKLRYEKFESLVSITIKFYKGFRDTICWEAKVQELWFYLKIFGGGLQILIVHR